MARIHIEEGQRFGKLTVVKHHHTDEKGRRYFLCRCDCGKETMTQASHLMTGHTSSCGCLQLEKSRKGFGESSRNNVLKGYKGNAKIRGIEFSLTDEQFFDLISRDCYYCGSSPSNTSKARWNNGDFVYNGIDRMNNSKGYVEGNVVPCCIVCNRAKNNMSYSEFMTWIQRLKTS